MKGIYICREADLNISSNGVGKKIHSQIETIKNYNITIDLINLQDSFMEAEFYSWVPFVKKNNNIMSEYNILDFLNFQEYNFVYIRMSMPSKAFSDLLKIIRSKNKFIKIIIEIPTYPFYGERKELIGKYFLLLKNHIIKSVEKNVDIIVTYSKDLLIWNKPTICISNGISLNHIKIKDVVENLQSIHMIAVANIMNWHGYDRLIEGIYRYYKNNGHVKIFLHIVGDGDGIEIKKYNKMIKQYKLYDHIFLHGACYGRKLDELYKVSDIGIDALGRHRSKIYYNSSLKGKEYGAKGLPIVSGVTTELDDYKDYEYYYRVSADETPINIGNIINFYNLIYNKKNKLEIARKIRQFTQEHFDYSITLHPLIKYLEN